MTTEPLNLAKIDEQVSCMQQTLCTNPELKEQLRVIALLQRGGAITVIFDKQNGLQFVKQETQLKVAGH